MQINELLQQVLGITFSTEKLTISINDLVLNSAQVQKGDVFIAIAGLNRHGREFITKAINNGAVCILCENERQYLEYQNGIPIIYTPNLPSYLPELARIFYSNPTSKLNLIGITGTNGKTSTSHYIAQLLHKLQNKTAVIGTNGIGVWGGLVSSKLTTPDIFTLNRTLKGFVAKNVKSTVMEVSSHALAQGRVDALQFSGAILTNITHEHLDYHKTMAAYVNSKLSLFTKHAPNFSIINLNSDYVEQFISSSVGVNDCIGYSLEKICNCPVAYIYATDIVMNRDGIACSIVYGKNRRKVTLPLYGRFNLENTLAATACLIALQFDFDSVVKLLPNLQAVKGRFQIIKQVERPIVIIDYAHTPDALKVLLLAVREHTDGEIVCLFGCGGDRDKAKRLLMAEVAEKYADKVVVTTDNPRTEVPEAITQDICKGFSARANYNLVLSRKEAILYAINNAKMNTVVVIAGKGHENYQEVNGTRHYFSDEDVAITCMQNEKIPY